MNTPGSTTKNPKLDWNQGKNGERRGRLTDIMGRAVR